jgi:pyruvate ferredoxin oxidoreductase beta subunit
MSKTRFARLRDLPDEHVLAAGNPLCAGCGAVEGVRQISEILGKKTVFVNAAGCLTLLSVYPFTPFHGSWFYTAMASAAAGAQGVRDALDILLQKDRMKAEDDLEVVVLTGDGAAYGMGLSATSGAIERGLDFLYLCYDNEGYGNTGQQYSEATPHGAYTSTSQGPHGFAGHKKDLFAIWTAHRPSYVATAVAAEPLDLARKIEKAAQLEGPRFMILLAPCPTGWGFDPGESVEIGKLAVKTGVWPLKEYVDGKVVHTKVPGKRLPVEEYLKKQGRYSHLFEPKRQEALLEEIQNQVDKYWDGCSPNQVNGAGK